jgi:chromosome segregation ATPase
MSDLKSIVDSLEYKLKKLVESLESSRLENEKLSLEIKELHEGKELIEEELRAWEDKYNALKLANSMLGSDKNTTEAKLKINTLIKELDHCIGSLSA